MQRITGIDPAAPATLHVDLVIGVDTLLADDPAPAHLVGSGPVPASVARALVAGASDAQRATLRRLFVTPTDRELVAMESRRRTFPRALAELIDRRDAARCRTPYCNAVIRHHDHLRPVHAGGATALDNGQGLCERCNHVKEHPGWTAWLDHTGSLNILTPATQVHTSRPPPLTPAARPTTRSRLEVYFADLVLAA